MNALTGTSGFSYDDWRGYFYPEELPKGQMLAYYAGRFPTVEVNSSYYSLPHAATLEQMARKVPEGFSFVFKANKEMTHAPELDPAVFAQFRAALPPLLDRGALGCVLAQFPWSFRHGPPQCDTLRRFRELMGEIPTVVEFRNSGWARDEVYEFLREQRLGYCCVDEPRLKGLMPPVALATSPIGYVRFHGRNAAKWWQHEHAYERYDYLYTEEELQSWVPKIQAVAAETERTYVFFNNHYQGKAGQNAQMLARLLDVGMPLAAEEHAAGDA
jgi:uncharacterized protein YecE (DUF72 family)